MESDRVAHHRVPVGRGAVASVAKASMSDARVYSRTVICATLMFPHGPTRLNER
jgi:hypothetical protein